LALACDFRIAAKAAKLGQTEVNLGLVPRAGGTQRLVRMLGQAKAKELVLLGLRLTSDEAAAIGLVTKTVENEAFSSEVREFAGRLARQAPIAIRLAKALLTRGVPERTKDFLGVLAFCGHPRRVARLQGRMLRGVGDHLELPKAGHVDDREEAPGFHVGIADDFGDTFHARDR